MTAVVYMKNVDKGVQLTGCFKSGSSKDKKIGKIIAI